MQFASIPHRLAAISATLVAVVAGPTSHLPRAGLALQQFVADSLGWNANSILVLGPTEAVLVDAEGRVPDATIIADRIKASGRHLKAILLTHPDEDHITGATTIVERFPGTPVYMSAAGIAELKAHGLTAFKNMKSRAPAGVLPDSLIVPQPFPGDRITVDGEPVLFVPDLQGDVGACTCNSVFVIPSTMTLLTGDLVFNDVHVWLAASTPASRTAWRAALANLKSHGPAVVIAGHKRNSQTPDTPAALDATDRYIADFDSLRAKSSNPNDLIAAMNVKYSGLAVQRILMAGAYSAYRN